MTNLNFASVVWAILRETCQECLAECAATQPRLEPSTIEDVTSDNTAAAKDKHIHIAIEDSSPGKQPSDGEEQEQRHSTGKKRKMEELEDEASNELKATKVEMLEKKIKIVILKQMIEIVSARRRATMEMEDNPTLKDMITRGLNSRGA